MKTKRRGNKTIHHATRVFDTLERRVFLSTVTFYPYTEYGVGTAPLSAVVFNATNDSKPDVVVASYVSGWVSVFPGTGGGISSTRTNYSVPFASAIAPADFDGDGRTDVAVTSYMTAGTVRVLRGMSNGSFSTALTPADTGKQPVALAAGDFDQDGKPDVAVVNSGDATLAILRGNGDGTFAPKAVYATGSTPVSVKTTDLDADGILDLVVSARLDNAINVFIGRADGTFAPAVSYPVGTEPYGLEVADLNVDGRPDVVVANIKSNNISVLKGSGDGTLAAQVQRNVNNAPSSVAVRDFDGDGLPDIVVANSGASTLTLLTGPGDGTFPNSQSLATKSGPVFVTAGLLNSDTAPDLVAVHQSGNAISVLLSPDGVGPTASLSFHPVPAAGATSFSISVYYSDTQGVPTSTLGNDDLTIYGPNGYSVNAVLTGTGTSGSDVVGYYRIDAPPGGFTAATNGLYEIHLNQNAVRDGLGNGTRATRLDTFVVSVGVPTAIIGHPNLRVATKSAEGQSIQFAGIYSVMSSDTISLYEWDTDYDGSQFVTRHTGAIIDITAGNGPQTYTVALRVTSASGVTSTVVTESYYVANLQPRDGTLTYTGTHPDNVVVTMTGLVDSASDLAAMRYWWDFNGDGVYDLPDSPLSSVTVPRQFFNPGSTAVWVRAVDPDGAENYFSVAVNVSAAVAVLTTSSAATVAEGATVSFSGAKSHIVNANIFPSTISKYEWDPNYDGVTFKPAAVGQTLTLSDLDGPKVRKIALRVTSNLGATAVSTATLTITNVNPVGTISANGRVVTVTPSATGFDVPADPVTFSYDFNSDGTFELTNVPTPSVTVPLQYLSSGITNVRIRVEDDDGGFVVHQVTVSIPKPTAVISATSTSIPETSNFTFFGVSSTVTLGGTLTYEWDANYNGTDFNPTATGTSLTISNLDGPATRTVALRVTTAEGLTSTTSATINIVNAGPRATISASGTKVTFSPAAGSTFDVNSDTVLFDYDFNNDGKFDLIGSPLSSVNVPREYLGKGSTTVAAKVRDEDGGASTYSIQMRYAIPSAVITAATSPLAEGQTLAVSGSNSTVTADGTISNWEWDINYDGISFNPTAIGAAATVDYTGLPAGQRTIALRVTSPNGETSIATLPVTIVNQAPSAEVTVIGKNTIIVTPSDSPVDTAAGFTYDFDFNNDGIFDLTRSRTSSAVIPSGFLRRGSVTVATRVTDQDGDSAIVPHTFAYKPDAVPVTATIVTPGNAIESTEKLSFTVSINQVLDLPLSLTLQTGGNLTLPSSVIIPAGQTSVTLDVPFTSNIFADDLRWASIAISPTSDDLAIVTTDGSTASARVLDDDISARIVPDPLDPKKKKTMLYVTASDIDDVLEFLPHKKGIEVRNRGATLGVFSKSVVRILAQGRDGNDSIRVDTKLKNISVLLGNAGDDTLIGSAGKDVLIGGTGSDQLRGGKADDLLIAGAIPNESDLGTICNLQAVWNTSKATKRLATLSTRTSLFSDLSLHQDSATDTLLGEGNIDLFVTGSSDNTSAPEKKEEFRAI